MATPTKRINFDLFKITLSEEATNTFEEMLNNTSITYSSLKKETGHILKSIAHGFVKKGKTICGTLTHNQMNDIPSSFDNDTHEQSELKLTPTQGLGHSTSFLYDEDLKMLMYESNKNGVSLNLFCNFFEKNHSIPAIITELVVDPTEITNFYNMTFFRKIHVKVAKIENAQVFDGKKISFGHMQKIADASKSGTIEYTLTSGNGQKKSLALEFVKEEIRQLLKLKGTDKIAKLEVTGRDEEEEKKVIDFISKRLRLSIEVERKRFNKDFALDEKYNKMYSEYLDKKPQLKIAYKKMANV